MAKVILITTRHISNVLKQIVEKGLPKPEKINSQNLQEQFLRYDSLLGTACANIRLQERIRVESKIPIISEVAKLSLFIERKFRLSPMFGGNTWFNNIDASKKDILRKEVIKMLCVDEYAKTNNKEHWDEIYKVSSNENSILFIAHECEKNAKDVVKVNYLNAIIKDIIAHDSIIDLSKTEWTFISHDQDWGCYTTGRLSLLDASKITSKLQAEEVIKKIVANKTTLIYTFSHVSIDVINQGIINSFNHDTIKGLIDNPKFFIESLFFEFDGDKITTNNNIKICNIIDCKSDILPHCLNWIARINDKEPIIIKGDKLLNDLLREDGRANFFDSSIWVRYAETEESCGNILKAIDNYKALKLYETDNAKEVREFKARMALNSFIKGGSHENNVTPFVFHSESEMKVKADKTLQYLSDTVLNRVKGPKWRFLIIDDNAFQESNAGNTKIKKCKIIQNTLQRNFCVVCESSHKYICPNQEYCTNCTNQQEIPTIYIDCAKSIREAIEKINYKRYDIILLDYLLGDVTKLNDDVKIGYPVSKDGNNFYYFKEREKIYIEKSNKQREYGTDFLAQIKDVFDSTERGDLTDNESRLSSMARGPFGKFKIFFISAFVNAISEKLLSEGMHYNTGYWYIARGACPTTTPELFRYNIISLMERQIQELTNINIKTTKVDNKESIITLLDLLYYIYGDQGSTRERAYENFDSLLHLRAHFNILKHDFFYGNKEDGNAQKNGSPLVQSLFPDMEHYSNAFWEHIQHLIYITAFGTIRQWGEMREVYNFVQPTLEKTGAKGKMLSYKIDTYITDIRNVNSY